MTKEQDKYITLSQVCEIDSDIRALTSVLPLPLALYAKAWGNCVYYSIAPTTAQLITAMVGLTLPMLHPGRAGGQPGDAHGALCRGVAL